MNFPPDLKEFLQLLGEHSVDYVIVGGYAVAWHGHPRFTGDLDVLILPNADNASKLLGALDAFGFESLDLSIGDFMEPEKVVQLGVPPLRIDLITSIEGVSNEDVFAHRIADEADGMRLYFISREDLRVNKRAVGRAQDIADLENL